MVSPPPHARTFNPRQRRDTHLTIGRKRAVSVSTMIANVEAETSSFSFSSKIPTRAIQGTSPIKTKTIVRRESRTMNIGKQLDTVKDTKEDDTETDGKKAEPLNIPKKRAGTVAVKPPLVSWRTMKDQIVGMDKEIKGDCFGKPLVPWRSLEEQILATTKKETEEDCSDQDADKENDKDDNNNEREDLQVSTHSTKKTTQSTMTVAKEEEEKDTKEDDLETSPTQETEPTVDDNLPTSRPVSPTTLHTSTIRVDVGKSFSREQVRELDIDPTSEEATKKEPQRRRARNIHGDHLVPLSAPRPAGPAISEVKARALLLKGITYTGLVPNTTNTTNKTPNWVTSLFSSKETSEIPINNTNEIMQCSVAGVDGYSRFPEFESNRSRNSVRKRIKKVGASIGNLAELGYGVIKDTGKTMDATVKDEAPKDNGRPSTTRKITFAETNIRGYYPPLQPPIFTEPTTKLTATGIAMKGTATGTALKGTASNLSINPSSDPPSNIDDRSQRPRFFSSFPSFTTTSAPSAHPHQPPPSFVPSFPARIQLPHPAYSPDPIRPPLTKTGSTFSFFGFRQANEEDEVNTPYYDVDVGDRYEWEPKLAATEEEGPTGYLYFPAFEKSKIYKQRAKGNRGGNI